MVLAFPLVHLPWEVNQSIIHTLTSKEANAFSLLAPLRYYCLGFQHWVGTLNLIKLWYKQ